MASLKNFNYIELWHGSLKDIEGRFGSGYASYFKFLRWLFVMNFGVALLSLGLLVVPQIILDTSASNKTTNTQSFNFRNIFIGDVSLFWFFYFSCIGKLVGFFHRNRVLLRSLHKPVY